MKFSKFLKDKINFILGFIVCCMVVVGYMRAMQIQKNAIFFVIIILSLFFVIGFLINYFVKNRYLRNLNNILDGLDEKYLLSEVMDKPRREENLAYYNILKRVNKSMLENVGNARIASREYKEYIESWVHEIKIPITSAKLLCENNKSEITNKIDDEIEEINNFVEQALFYARMEQVSNDFMIKELNLEDVVRTILSRNKKLMIQNNMKVEVKNIDVIAYSDEKWLEFILNQIVINAIKYKKNDNSCVVIEAHAVDDVVSLYIADNGIGIKKSEIDRIFDKGFTGTNGRNQKRSTGIGLYLCKKLCMELNIDIFAESVENQYTKICLNIPRKNTK